MPLETRAYIPVCCKGMEAKAMPRVFGLHSPMRDADGTHRTPGPLTHDGIAPELRNLPRPHGAEQRLPDLNLEHLAHDDLHGHAGLPAVIDHRPLKVVLQCLEVESDLPPKKAWW